MVDKNNCNYIFYADESGDHSLRSIDSKYPLFVLSICGFKKSVYCNRIVPRFQSFKFSYFGHDAIVFHEREIRKQLGVFGFLVNLKIRTCFMNDLTDLVEKSRFKIFASIIDKRGLKEDLFPQNPYVLTLRECLVSCFLFLKKANETGSSAYFVFERRGKKEDDELELEFLRIINGDNILGVPFKEFVLIFSDKKSNSTGLQIADLTARPIGLNRLRQNQQNRAFDAIRSKILSVRRSRLSSY